MSKAHEIWDRACDDWQLRNTAVGDRALAGVLLMHNWIMNSGMLDAVENLDDSQLASAKSGYQYFGLDSVAELLRRTKDALAKERAAPEVYQRYTVRDITVEITFEDDELGELEPLLDAEYAKYVPDDPALFERFEGYLAANPGDFAETSGE